MPNSKRYLEVPFAQKDQAKALGARWDPARKKWYIPNGVESAAFAQWKPAAINREGPLSGETKTGTEKSSSATVSRRPAKPAADPRGVITIAHTAPADKHFVPYCGEDPPWE